MPSLVSAIPAAVPSVAQMHFSNRLSFETDCTDVWSSLNQGAADFVLLDVRGPAAYAIAHVPGAINLPHRAIDEQTLAGYPRQTLFVVYCAGAHCNGADRAAARLAGLGRSVKVMLGGLAGWREEGQPLNETAAAPAACGC